MVDIAAIERVLAALPQRFRGPGGVAGVLHQGRVVASAVWGHADLETRAPMRQDSLLPICSISKQFTVGAVLATVGVPEALDAGLADLLPNLTGERPSVRDLCNNQSGLRDYWALSVLQGGMAEQEFRHQDAAPLLALARSTHFAPGTSYSYSNGNFRLVSDLLERATGQDIATLYARHLWQPAGMASATLAADTRMPPGGTVGYEGTPATGFMPAPNGIWWQGDAGIAASLEDMLAWEGWIDATRNDPDGIYARLAVPQPFRNGAASAYGLGLMHSSLGGMAFTGHGGGLRGYRSHRMYSPQARLSVVVMFNHQGDAHGAAQTLARAALGLPDPVAAPVSGDWAGQWICPETGLLARLTPTEGRVALSFGTSPELLGQGPDGTLVSGSSVVRRDGAHLHLCRAAENYAARLEPVPFIETADSDVIAGRYRSAEMEADLVIETNGPAAAVWFDGMLGQGRPEPLYPAGPDLWTLVTRRSMDAPAPGEWTLRLRRDGAGKVEGLDLGCWLARGITYARTASAT